MIIKNEMVKEMYNAYIKANPAETIKLFKETDSGRFGKAFEINVKLYLNGNRGNSSKVSGKGKTDVTNKGIKYEIKSNCGEINKGIEKNDYIIYTMDNVTDYARPQNARVIPADEFVALVEKLGLMRTKKSSNGELKTTIQSYRNSKRKTALLADAIAQYPTLAQWKATL